MSGAHWGVQLWCAWHSAVSPTPLQTPLSLDDQTQQQGLRQMQHLVAELNPASLGRL